MMLYSLIMIYSFFDKDPSKVTFFANEMGILGVDFDKINLDDDDNFDKLILKL